jgi:prepilin-type N-terminal cleavage/methylation domain-containing protein
VRAGFSLIEMCIVLIISGLLLSGLAGLWQVRLIQAKNEENAQKMEAILLALSQYTYDEPGKTDEVRFPCPASLTSRLGEENYGAELCPLERFKSSLNMLTAGKDIGGAFVLEGKDLNDNNKTDIPELILMGAIPTQALGLPETTAIDAYGNRFFYAVGLGLTQPDALLQKPAVPNNISLLNERSEEFTQARFVVFSAGSDQAGSYTQAGVKNAAACRKTRRSFFGFNKLGEITGDSRNCAWQKDKLAVFRAQSYISMGLNKQYYDDLFAFRMFTPEDQNGWWMATDESGRIIRNKNVDRVEIGPVANLDDKTDILIVGGNIRTTQDMIVEGNMDIGAELKASKDLTVRGNLRVSDKPKDREQGPRPRLDVDGGIKIGQQVQKDLECDKPLRGMLRLKTSLLEYCDGDKWRVMLVSDFECPAGMFMVGINLDSSPKCLAPPPPE